MPIDITAATRFMTAHARLLDRQRLRLALGEDAGAAALAALEAHRNPDGGYGWGLEPDLRAPESQPGGALHAFEAIAEAAPVRSARAAELCDWLARVALPGGALPFALPVADSAACAPFWAGADPEAPSLHITCAVLAEAHGAARHDPAVAGHPWLAAATRWCLDRIAERTEPGFALETMFALRMLDVLHDADPEAAAALERLAGMLPASAVLHVTGGAPDESVRALDLAPAPGPLRRLLSPDAVAADVDRLAGGQREDGGWEVDFEAYSPAAALEWRGYATVRAVRILRGEGIAA